MRVNNWNIYLKPFFHENSFLTKFEQKGPKFAPKDFFFDFLKNLKIYFKSFFGNNLKWKLVLLLLFLHQSHIASNCFLRYYHFKCVWPGMSKLPKITSLLFLCNILKKTWLMKLIFCMQASMKACYKLILWF